MIRRKRILWLRVKECYFIAVRDGLKPFEYRLDNDYWRPRILNPDGSFREYDEVAYCNAYKTGAENIMRFPWRCPHREEITHEHFGPDSVGVFAIPVGKGGAS